MTLTTVGTMTWTRKTSGGYKKHATVDNYNNYNEDNVVVGTVAETLASNYYKSDKAWCLGRITVRTSSS
jgi:hypothetical protein